MEKLENKIEELISWNGHAPELIAQEIQDIAIAFAKWKDKHYTGIEDLWFCQTTGAGPFTDSHLFTEFINQYNK